jgi:hypothetical protein
MLSPFRNLQENLDSIGESVEEEEEAKEETFEDLFELGEEVSFRGRLVALPTVESS